MSFEGFRPELIDFLSELAQNNNREWFQTHRDDYEHYLVEPAREFVVALGDCLKSLGSDSHAEPHIRGSIFAINRDIRFARDKTPYKTYLDQAVLDPAQGASLEAVVRALESQGLEVGGQTHQKAPAGLPANHPGGDWQWLVDLLAD
jgi:uncharacterized protein (DUF2461 family)